MITINLLPIGAFKEKLKGRVFLAAYGLFLAMALIALFSVKTNVLDGNLERKETEKAAQQKRQDDINKKVAEANDKTTLTYRQWQQLSAILELEERRRDQTRLMVEIEKLLPKDDAWLLGLIHDKGVLTMEGISKDKDAVSHFLSRLENATYLEKQSVTLVEISQNMVINNIKLTKFKVTAKTRFPSPTILDEGMPDFELPSRAIVMKLVEAAAPDLLKAAAPSKGKGRK